MLVHVGRTMKYDKITKEGITRRLARSEGFREQDFGDNLICAYYLDEDLMAILPTSVSPWDWFEGYYDRIYFRNKEECAKFNKEKAQDYIGRCEKILKNI